MYLEGLDFDFGFNAVRYNGYHDFVVHIFKFFNCRLLQQ
jgi:hypothetical protein